MNLYQAGYFRLGKQGVNAGWSIVSPSSGMSPVAMEGFKGIAANLTELKSSGRMPSHCMGVFEYENFVYLIHINYNATGEDARGVSYTHGYVFNKKEYYEMCKTPELLFGVDMSEFPMEYDESVGNYPVKTQLAHSSFSVPALLSKYGFDAESYRKLVLSAICSISENDSSLCIKYQCDKEEYLTVYREIMFLIMSGLPYHLRTRIRAYSFGGSSAKISISDEIGRGNYFDLDTKETNCGLNRVMNYRFTMLYNNYTVGDEVLNNIFAVIGDFTQEVFPEALKAPNCEQVEAAFNGLQKKTIERGTAVSLLTTFLTLRPSESEATDNYLALLLSWIYEEQTLIQSKEVYNQLFNRQSKSQNLELKKNFAAYSYMELVKCDQNSAIEKMWALQQKNTEDSLRILDLVKANNKDLHDLYYTKKFLPSTLSSLPAAKVYLQQAGDVLNNPMYCECIVKVLKRLAESKMRAEIEYRTLVEIRSQFNNALNMIPETQFDKKLFMNFLEKLFWEQFDINTFRVIDAEMVYVSATEAGKYETAQDLMEIADYIQNRSTDVTLPYRILVLGEVFSSKEARADFKEYICKNVRPSLQLRDTEQFDTYLVCYYDADKNAFALPKWITNIYKEGKQICFDPERLRVMMKKSKVLTAETKRRGFINSLNQALDNKKEMAQRYGKQVVVILQRCYDIISDKPVRSELDAEIDGNYMFSFHRMIIGMTVFMTIGLILRSLWKYYFPQQTIVPIIVAAVTALILVLVMGVKFFVNGADFEELMDDMGMASGAHLFSYLFAVLTMILVAVAIICMVKMFYAGIAYIAICAVISIVVAVVYAYMNEDY